MCRCGFRGFRRSHRELFARGAYVPREESERIQRLLRSSKRDPASRLGVRNMRGVREGDQGDGLAARPRVVQEALF